MDAKLIFEIAKLVEGGLKGDRDKVAAYAEMIAKRLDDSEDAKGAQRIRQAAQERPSRPAAATRADLNTISQIPVPVDSDSRLPVADAETIHEEVFLSLSTPSEGVLNRFLKCYENSDELFRHGVGIAPTLLVYGPPGGGKTQLARYVASKVGLPLLTARSDALISSYLGSTAKNIRALFDHAGSRPCVLFLDEIDSIAKMRDDQHELGELKRVVISLLQNIDALSKDHIVIAATNHPHLLDPAVWRRFSYKLELPPPDQSQRAALLSHFFGGFADEKTIDTLTALTSGMNGSQLRDIANESIRDTVIDEPKASQTSLFTATKIALEQIAHRQISDSEEKLRAIVDACGFDAIPQRQLAEMTGLSQSTVSRLISQWKDGHVQKAIDQDRRAG